MSRWLRRPVCEEVDSQSVYMYLHNDNVDPLYEAIEELVERRSGSLLIRVDQDK